LPFDGILAGSKEVDQLKSLFDFLEKDLDSPPCKVQFTDGVGRPFKLVGDKFHETGFTILQHTGIDHADFILTVAGMTAVQQEVTVLRDTVDRLQGAGADSVRVVCIAGRDGDIVAAFFPRDAGRCKPIAEIVAILIPELAGIFFNCQRAVRIILTKCFFEVEFPKQRTFRVRTWRQKNVRSENQGGGKIEIFSKFFGVFP